MVYRALLLFTVWVLAGILYPVCLFKLLKRPKDKPNSLIYNADY